MPFPVNAATMKPQAPELAKVSSSMGAEGVRGASGKPPVRARRREIIWVCKSARDNLQKIEQHFLHQHYKGEAINSLACKSFIRYGAEGFQRWIGKPFGRARGREILCVSKNAMLNLQ